MSEGPDNPPLLCTALAAMGNCCGGEEEVPGDSYVHMPDDASTMEMSGGAGGSSNPRDSKAKLARDYAKSTFRPLKNHKESCALMPRNTPWGR